MYIYTYCEDLHWHHIFPNPNLHHHFYISKTHTVSLHFNVLGMYLLNLLRAPGTHENSGEGLHPTVFVTLQRNLTIMSTLLSNWLGVQISLKLSFLCERPSAAPPSKRDCQKLYANSLRRICKDAQKTLNSWKKQWEAAREKPLSMAIQNF